MLRELNDKVSLSWSSNPNVSSPAKRAVEYGQRACFKFLTQIGGAQTFWAEVASDPSWIDDLYPWLLDDPQFLNLAAKRSWLRQQLRAVVDEGAALSLVARRDNLLDRLCANLGIDESTGRLDPENAQQARPRALSVSYAGEASAGDGLRREWFGLATAEIVHPDRGLFERCCDGATLQPRPDSADVAGADHLSYFALLGRIAGMALFHGETLGVALSNGFMKGVFGYPITFDGLESVDQELHRNMKDLRSYSPPNRSTASEWTSQSTAMWPSSTTTPRGSVLALCSSSPVEQRRR